MTYIEKIIDVTTGEETIRPYTAKEIAVVEAHQAQSLAEQTERDTQQALKATTKQAVLDKLGLTIDEVAALLG